MLTYLEQISFTVLTAVISFDPALLGADGPIHTEPQTVTSTGLTRVKHVHVHVYKVRSLMKLPQAITNNIIPIPYLIDF